MRRLFISLMWLAMIASVSTLSAHADCPACAARAAEFWPLVQADVGNTSPALADYLSRHELAHAHSTQPIYFLTPDCGMYPAQLESVLDSAKQLNIHMTIFLLGNMIDKWPDASRALIQRIVAEGHELGLHSYDHKSFVNMSHEHIYDEVVRNWALIDWALGYHYPIRFIRMPYGARNAAIMQEIGQLGLQSVFWDIDSLGWRDYATVPIVHKQVMSKIRYGSIIVFHCSSVADRGALPLYVNELRAQGYEPRLLSTLRARPTAADLVGYPRVHITSATQPAIAEPTQARETPGERRMRALLDPDNAQE